MSAIIRKKPRKNENDAKIIAVKTRSSAVAKRPRNALCPYSFYILKWCGYPMVKKIRTLCLFVLTWSTNVKKSPFSRTAAHINCFSWRRPCDNRAMCCMDRKTIQCLPNTSQHVYLSIFNSFRVIRWLVQCVSPKIVYHIFVSPGDTPGAITLNVVWMEREFDAYKLSRSM